MVESDICHLELVVVAVNRGFLLVILPCHIVWPARCSSTTSLGSYRLEIRRLEGDIAEIAVDRNESTAAVLFVSVDSVLEANVVA
jgi:hypothetical protein